MRKYSSIFLTLVFALAVPFVSSAQSDEAKMFGAIFDGPPALASTKMDPSAYVPSRVQKLANAKIAYVNWTAIEELLKGLGFKNPPRELTPEVTKALLDKAGYAMPMQGEPSSAYVQEFRDLFSIRYGGHWINFNFGSGRNGAGGLVDIKGIGKTSLVRPWSDGGHGSGTMTLTEAVHEAVWSNVLHEELPYGANRVLFIITTGTRIDGNQPGAEARVLMVREDPIRPAYFQQNGGVTSHLMNYGLREMHTAADQERMRKVLPKLADALPLPKDFSKNASLAEKLRAGYLEFVDRTAHAYATGYSRQIMLSGVSTSNTQIDGSALDFGATTALIGYAKAQLPIGESPHGTTDTLKNDLILELARDLREVLPMDLVTALPSDQELSERMDSQFKERVLQGMLELAGTPNEFSAPLLLKSEGKKLAETILKIAQAGSEKPFPVNYRQMPGRKGTYNLERVLNALINNDAELEKALPNSKLRIELLNDFAAYSVQLQSVASREGILPENLKAYVREAVRARNRSMYRGVSNQGLHRRLETVAKKFTDANEEMAIQSYIDQSVETNIREFKSGAYQLVVADRDPKRKQKFGRTVLDLRPQAAGVRCGEVLRN